MGDCLVLFRATIWARWLFDRIPVDAVPARLGTAWVEGFPFAPFPGLRIGDGETAVVARVSYLGLQDGKPKFAADCERRDAVVDPKHPKSGRPLGEIEADFARATGWSWTFRDLVGRAA